MTRSRHRLALIAAAFAMLGVPSLRGQELEPIRYTVRFPAPQTHYVEVEARIPTGGRPQIEVMMPVWTPGSYLVREFARNVEGLIARGPDQTLLAIEKTRKNRWRIPTNGAAAIVLAYRVYAREMSVRTSWVEDRLALLNGAPTFITLVESRARPHEVLLKLPPDWTKTMTGLAPASAQPHHYHAPDYDTLVDSPIVAGNPAVYEFEVSGKKHYLVNTGEGGVWDGARAAKDLERVVREALKVWGSLPYDRYLFLNMITESSGGLEHKNSTVIMTSRWSTRTRQAYLGWLSTASHEFFHAWNVKRLRPIELGPFDYENEVYTKGLWIAEGVTDYYADLQLHRAGLSTREEYLQQLSNQITRLQTTPGRLVQPVEVASYDAWIKYYRPDENSGNTSVSYYTKGAVLGVLLDAKIRRATAGAKNLDDLMRLLYQRYAGPRGFTPLDFRAAVQEIVGAGAKEELARWFVKALETTEELDYTEALEWFGLRFRSDPETRRAWLGLSTRNDNGRVVVTEVRRGTPGHEAGFDAEDEILAIGDFRIRAGQLETRLGQYQPGDKVSILIARRDELRRLEVTLGMEPPRRWTLELRPDTTDEQRARLRAWLGS